MDQVDLPLLKADDTPDDAIREMNKFERRFVIADLGPRGFYSFSNRDILQAWAQRVNTLRDIKGGQPLVRVPVNETVQELMSLAWGHPQRELARAQIEAGTSLFGLSEQLVVSHGLIQVLTQHEETRGAALSKTKDCLCSNSNCGHNDQCPPAGSANPCPNCGLNTWRCA